MAAVPDLTWSRMEMIQKIDQVDGCSPFPHAQATQRQVASLTSRWSIDEGGTSYRLEHAQAQTNMRTRRLVAGSRGRGSHRVATREAVKIKKGDRSDVCVCVCVSVFVRTCVADG